ncbi:MAG: DNA methylase [Bacilli bacterium]|nr:DNA methylase [Bacilli bacterium]
MNKIYLCIDLKSFYASVECVDLGLNPLTTNLVVADSSRTEKTICLAVTPALKSFGIKGRARLFEVIQRVNEVNKERKNKVKRLTGKSYNLNELEKDQSLAVDFITAKPRMAHYIKVSAKIYEIYLKYVSKEDIHVYSIDEVFIDVSNYLKTYRLTPGDFAKKMIIDVYEQTGITATAGIGTNMYLAKVAMDMVAKKMRPDKYGVRMAYLNEEMYRKVLWDYQPITDFWRVGKGYAKKLAEFGLHTMGDIALFSTKYEDILYNLFGVNAELLIDHAWGVEPCTIAHIKNYQPMGKSIGSGQVLHCPYDFAKARLIVKEMVDALSLDLFDKCIFTNKIVLTIGYDIENLTNPKLRQSYDGEITTDYLGREIPKHAHGTATIKRFTSSSHLLTKATIELYDQIVNKNLLIRRINISAINLVDKEPTDSYEQLDLFTNVEALQEENEMLEKEKRRQQAVLNIKKRYGKNAIMKGMNLEEGATMKERNDQIGGHKA